MVYIESPSTNPAFNLALEQYVFDRMDRSQEYFMLWQNDNTVVIGKNQNAFAEVNQKVADAKHISVVRRLSGGGAVYHDLGNLNSTFILNAKDATDLVFVCSVSRLQSCCVLSMCLLRSMAETISALKGKNSPAIPSI